MGFRYPVQIERTTGGTWNEDGNWSDGTVETLTIRASVQPLNGKEYTQVQPEGDHTVNAVKVYSSVPLLPDRESTQEADVVLWQGSRFRVVQCDAFQSGVIPHYKSYALEVISRNAASTEKADP